jgi:hypothetical protein
VKLLGQVIIPQEWMTNPGNLQRIFLTFKQRICILRKQDSLRVESVWNECLEFLRLISSLVITATEKKEYHFTETVESEIKKMLLYLGKITVIIS